MHILDCCQFSDIHISQGSVATYLRCGGIFKYEFVANLPVSLPVKECENRLTFGEVMGKSLVSCFFLRHSVVIVLVAAFSALTLLVGRQEGHPACKKTKWWGADLHTAQLMPLPLTASCFSKIQMVLPFWYRLTRVVPNKGPLNGCVIVLVVVMVLVDSGTGIAEPV